MVINLRCFDARVLNTSDRVLPLHEQRQILSRWKRTCFVVKCL